MIRIFIFISLFITTIRFSALSQDSMLSIDKNELYFSQELFLDNPNIITLNNEFIKHWIGINIDDVEVINMNPDKYPFVIRGINENNDSLIIKSDISKNPVVINGIKYDGNILVLKSSKNKRLLSAEQIKNLYFPDIKSPCIYMVNQYFITTDAESYKFDKDFIFKVIAMKSTDFDALKNLPPFDIIRIYTNTRRNREDHPEL